MNGSRQVARGAQVYGFSIEAQVSPDHMLRSVDRFVDLAGIQQHSAPFYSSTGRPSVDPELVIRMLLVGYIMGIRSERRLCEEVHLTLADRWFCRLDPADPAPDHSTFSKTRHGRFRDSDLLRHLSETLVAQCIAQGLTVGQRLALDARILQANANRQNSTPKSDWQRGSVAPGEAPRAVRDCLETLDDAAFGAASLVEPTFPSHSDPASQRTGARGGSTYFAYSTNYPIETDTGVILDVKANRSIRQAEVGSVRTMIGHVNDTFGVKPERLIADFAYGTVDMLDWLDRQRRLAPHIPVFDKSARSDGAFERADFVYHAENGVYICPAPASRSKIAGLQEIKNPVID